LIWNNSEYHISHEVDTITYYFADSSRNLFDTYTWTTDISETEVNDIKESYAESMKKWNDVYYYSYDENGNMTLHKVINVMEGADEESSNLIIYPTHNDSSFMARAFYSDWATLPLEINGKMTTHCHYDRWWMEVNIDYFKSSSSSSVYCKEAAGAHELGHILGIYDVDECCSSSHLAAHHEELIMGYGDSLVDRATDISYKDIAGVSITRGFHTDDDHVWMLRNNTDGTKDVICAQCNGVRYDIDITTDEEGNCYYEGKLTNAFESCVHHGGTNEKMLLVATDGERNFIKCQYCRHIDEVDIVNYDKVTKYSGATYSKTIAANKEEYRKISVLASGKYTFKSTSSDILEIDLYDDDFNNTGKLNSDVFTADGCEVSLSSGTYYLKFKNPSSTSEYLDISILPPPHVHDFSKWKVYSETQHIEMCECGSTGFLKGEHVVKQSTIVNGKSYCMYCGYYVTLTEGHLPIIHNNIPKVSVNGSYIMPNGIIVLVDKDVEAYLNGTLVFYDRDDLPVTQ